VVDMVRMIFGRMESLAIIYKKSRSMLGYLHHDNKEIRNPSRALSRSDASRSSQNRVVGTLQDWPILDLCNL
jgi:hypothetical protein